VRRIVPLIVLGVMLLASDSASQQRAQHGRLFKAEDLGILEGPDREVWQRPDQIMDALGIADGSVVAELGAAGGWFTIRLARRVGPNGKVYAEDIQQPMLEVIRRRLPRENLNNVTTVLGTADDPKLPEQVDAIVMVDAYHEMDQPVAMLRNAARALKDDGRVGIVEFTLAGGGPGPLMEERIDPERVIREANAADLVLIARPNFLRYQYLLVFGKKAASPATRPPR
jgi:SAM-dependent methyltransferase